MKYQLLKFQIVIAALLIMVSCSSESGESATESYAPAMEEYTEGDMMIEPEMALTKQKSIPEQTTTTDGTTQVDTQIEKKIIKTADISISVEDYQDALVAVKKVISEKGAYIGDESEENASYRITGNILIRVPREKFDDLMGSIVGIAETVDSKSIHVEDVTEQFIDIQSRLKNKREVENQYREILKQAKTIDEILRVNEHLRIITEEIESKEGRLKYLQSQVNFSTIRLYMYQNYEQSYIGFFGKFGEAFSGGWDGLLNFIIGLVYLWPFLIIAGVLTWWIRKRILKRKTKNI